MSLAPHSGSFRASQQSCSVTARDESPYVSIFTSLLKTQFTQKEDLLNHLLAFMLFTICLTLVFQWRAQKEMLNKMLGADSETNTSSCHVTKVWCFSKPVKLQFPSAHNCCLGKQFTVLRHNQALNFYRFDMSSSASSGESLQEADSTIISQKADVKNYSMMTPAEKLLLCERRAQSLADSEEVHIE